MRRWKIILPILVVVCVAIWAMDRCWNHKGGIEIENAYMRVNPQGTAGGIYMEIENNGAANRLVGAASPAARMVEIHESKMDENGVMSMNHLPQGIAIPKGKDVMLARGGLHVMLMGLKEGITDGSEIPVTLEFQDHSVELLVTVDQNR